MTNDSAIDYVLCGNTIRLLKNNFKFVNMKFEKSFINMKIKGKLGVYILSN